MAQYSTLTQRQPDAASLKSPIPSNMHGYYHMNGNNEMDVDNNRGLYETNNDDVTVQHMPPPYHPETGNTSPQRNYYEASEWIWEVLAWVLSTTAFTGILIILMKFNDTPVDRWPINIQISTVVAFLAQVVQSALLVPTESCIGQLKWTWFRKSRITKHLESFDEASRGPWGSAKLICRLSSIPHLVHVGAVATIFMLFFSAFFQQAVETRLKLVEDAAIQSTVSRSVHYNSSAIKGTLYNDNLYTSDMSGVDVRIANAINSAMASSSVNMSDVRANCPTGQCNWEPYTTLAICSSTEDISSQLMRQKERIITLPGITVSSGLTLWMTSIYGYGNGTIGHTGQAAEMNKFDLKNSDSSMDDLAHIYLAYQDPCLRKGTIDNRTESWRAFKGTIRLCLQTLKTNFNTSTDTTMIQSHTNLTWNGVEGFTFLDWTEGQLATWDTRLSDDSEEFTMGMVASLFIGGQVATTLNVSGIFLPEYDNYVSGGSLVSDFIADIYGPDPVACTNTTGVGFEGFTKRLGYVATGLTNAFRTANTSTSVHGRSLKPVQYIHVKFWSLAFPGSVFVLITVFFVATIIHTVKVPVWKSSQLAVLYTMSEPHRLGTKASMEKEAEMTRMKFSSLGNWQLKYS